jgi:flagellar biosynthesis chaperone FliJ
MKSLHTLLKVAQRRMDELGVEATRLAQHIDQLRMQEATILAREETEMVLASNDPSLATLLPAYRARVKLQTGQVQLERAEKERKLAEVRALLNRAYQEKSKFEQLIEQEAIRAATERAAKDQAALDEVAINRAGMAGK